VKNFKTDSLKDFMAIKRHLLIEQKNAIETEEKLRVVGVTGVIADGVGGAGFVGVVKDNDADTNCFVVVSNGTSYFYLKFTKAT
jgi:hypothetical protein